MSNGIPLFLFGSGISPAPKVHDLTERVLTADLHRPSGDGLWWHGKPSNRPDPKNDSRHVRHLLGCLRHHCARLWSVHLSDVNYEQIAGLCRQLNYHSDTARDPAIAPFVDSLREQLAISEEDFLYLPWSAQEWISSAIYWEFQRCAPTSEDTQRFISSVIRPLGRSVIVTLNHDTYVEDEFGPDLNVGFSDTRRFSPDRLREPSSHKLLKLHGSVNWSADDTITTFRPDWRSTPPSSAPLILSGTVSKLEDYNYLLFPWLWAEFQNSLRHTRRLVVTGYGFKDLGVNSRLTDWLHHYPNARILVLHKHPEELRAAVADDRLGGVQNFFRRWSSADFGIGDALPKARILFGRAWFAESSSYDWQRIIAEFFRVAD